MKYKLKAGTTSYIADIFIQDSSSTTGAGLGSLAYNTSGLTAKYKRKGQSSWTSITLATATAGTWTSGGFAAATSADTGDYELHIPNACLAAGATSVVISIVGAANMVPCKMEIELDAVDYQDSVRFGLTALPNAAAGSASGLPANNSDWIATSIQTDDFNADAVTIANTMTVNGSPVGSGDATAANQALILNLLQSRNRS